MSSAPKVRVSVCLNIGQKKGCPGDARCGGTSAPIVVPLETEAILAAAANKLKYPKGAAQVVGVKEYLEDLAKKQTFFRDAAGNSRVSDTGHKWAKVKFGEFTKEAYDEWRAKGGKKLPNQMY